MNAKIVLLLKFNLFLFPYVSGILTRPITEDYTFGCQWGGGGMGSTLTCDCQPDAEVFHLRDNSISSISLTAISLSGCNEVIFDTNAIHTMRTLREVHLSNIKNLTIEEYGFSWEGYVNSIDINTPSVTIVIRDTNIQRISSYAFTGRISQIRFENVVVENLAPFSFSSLVQSQSIDFLNTTTINVHPQAFKKFPTGQLTITDSNIAYLPSRSFSELTVTENFLIDNSTFGTVKSGAFLIHNPRRFEVTDSKFDILEGEGFRVTTRGDVLFRNIHFNSTYATAFLGVSVNLMETSIRKVITFNSLVFETFDLEVLRINTTSFDSKLSNICIKQSCDCVRMENMLSGTEQIEEFYCLDNGADTLYQEFRSNSCSLFPHSATIIILVVVVLILALIIGLVLWCYFKKIYRCDRYGEKDKKKKLSLIVPDGRTYRETELHVIVERTDLLTTDL